jgi:uncharacterized spore protein YtfJ
MDTQQALSGIQSAINAHRVFGVPIHANGATIIPTTSVRGGGGGGGRSEQGGAGFGLKARPVGVYVIRDDKVSWRPAVDVNRVILGGQVVALLLMLSPLVRRVFSSRRTARPWWQLGRGSRLLAGSKRFRWAGR